MKIKQKSFFFEDYNESEITVNNAKNNQPKVSLSRVTFLFYIFLSVILIFGIKIIYLSLSPDKNFFLQNINQNFIKERRDILDRNGVILARNINIYDAAKASADVISDQYKNKYINIVGNKSYKVSDLLKIVAELVGSRKKIIYLKKKAIGHYIKSPQKLKIKKGTNYKFKKSIKLHVGLKNLINDLS